MPCERLSMPLVPEQFSPEAPFEFTPGQRIRRSSGARPGRPGLRPLPLAPFRSVLRLKRRLTREGMVSVGGNLHSVPDSTKRRIVEVHTLADEIRIFEDGALIAAHPVFDGSHQRRIEAGHRRFHRFQRRRDTTAGIVLNDAGNKVVQRLLAATSRGRSPGHR